MLIDIISATVRCHAKRDKIPPGPCASMRSVSCPKDTISLLYELGDEGVLMYKVAIIDDEPIIVEGLSRVVPWEKYHCQVAGTAGNGQEGLKIIREIRPDMIFSDISMPGMDGLTMIAALRVEFPDMLITILTGFRDFDFAQKAIRLGVSRFLLKPSNMDEIEEALAFMTESLDRKMCIRDRYLAVLP